MARRQLFRNFLFLVAAGALCGVPCRADTITVNGVCELGNCAMPGVLSDPGSTTLSLNTTFTLANTDEYQVVLDATPTINAGLVTLGIQDWSVTYLGNGTNTASAADQIVVDVAQDFQTAIFSTTVEFAFSGFFLGPIADGSTIESDALINGVVMASAGPATSPDPFTLTSTQSPYTTTDNTNLERTFTFDFASGSGVGAEISRSDVSSVPEPGSALLLLTGVAALAFSKFPRRGGRNR